MVGKGTLSEVGDSPFSDRRGSETEGNGSFTGGTFTGGGAIDGSDIDGNPGTEGSGTPGSVTGGSDGSVMDREPVSDDPGLGDELDPGVGDAPGVGRAPARGCAGAGVRGAVACAEGAAEVEGAVRFDVTGATGVLWCLPNGSGVGRCPPFTPLTMPRPPTTPMPPATVAVPAEVKSPSSATAAAAAAPPPLRAPVACSAVRVRRLAVRPSRHLRHRRRCPSAAVRSADVRPASSRETSGHPAHRGTSVSSAGSPSADRPAR